MDSDDLATPAGKADGGFERPLHYYLPRLIVEGIWNAQVLRKAYAIFSDQI